MPFELTTRQKIAHLYRRFGFGATPEELDSAEKLGLERTFQSFLEFDDIEESFPVSPWEICLEEGKEEIYLDPYRIAAWWGLRMVITRRPLQEKLTLFWHDHFAVSGSKVEFGPMMVDYLDAIRRHGAGDFKKLLHEVSKSPAMLFWLDAMHSQRGAPNENFARELFELFTVGLGSFDENDVREASRAFTGWGIRFLILEQGGEKAQEVAKECVRNNRPMTAFAFSPSLYDDGMKSILGQRRAWTGEEVIDVLADRAETARMIARKLWEFFAYADPEAKVVERLASRYVASGRSIRSVVRSIFESPEFWSERCYRQSFKSPADFVVPILRQLGIGAYLLLQHGPKPNPQKPLAKPLRDIAGATIYLMNEQGMLPLFPPDVAGWNWGSSWISSSAMTHRLHMGTRLMGVGTNDYGGAGALIARVVAPGVPIDAKMLVSRYLEVFDAEIPEDKRLLLERLCDQMGASTQLASPKLASAMFGAMNRLLFACPEFQMA